MLEKKHCGDKIYYRDKKPLQRKGKQYTTSRLQRKICAPLSLLFLNFACIPYSPFLLFCPSQNLEEHLQFILTTKQGEKKKAHISNRLEEESLS